MTLLIRTHYRDWALGRDFRPDSLPRVRAAWRAGHYAPGPWEAEAPRTSEHRAICEALFAKYNRDDRPDGRLRRAMTVGDLVQIGGSFYVCARVGFKPVPGLAPAGEAP